VPFAVAATTNGTPSTVGSAYFSNVGPDDGIKDGSKGHTRGRLPDVGSPGMENAVLVVSTSGSTRNATMSGTSMSAPDVASAAALLVDERPTLAGDHATVRNRIRETASPAPRVGETEIGAGLLNVSNALADERPNTTQVDARTEQAQARDNANRALAGRIARILQSRGGSL